jgi:hypothetical protein
MVRSLDFAAFPSVILLTTLLRLSLNVASTRVVLLEGHTGAGAAGAVIESFGHFLIGGNFAVGLIVFAILVVINFIVVTKGAERIAEIGTRFTLDAMPGKQMAIDADLNAGQIDDKEAKRRRAELGDEAQFFRRALRRRRAQGAGTTVPLHHPPGAGQRARVAGRAGWGAGTQPPAAAARARKSSAGMSSARAG